MARRCRRKEIMKSATSAKSAGNLFCRRQKTRVNSCNPWLKSDAAHRQNLVETGAKNRAKINPQLLP
jgi:hypothetical protein